MPKRTKSVGVISKTNFINFLASATPEEVNKYILEKGKPKKLIQAIIFLDDYTKEEKSNDRNNHQS